MMPNTSVSPAAMRNSITPSCSPLSACSRTRTKFNARVNAKLRDERRRASVPSRRDKPAPQASGLSLFHRAFLGVGILVIREHGLLDLHHRVLAGRPRHGLQQIEILDRKMVAVVSELPAGRREVGLLHRR